MFIKKKKKVLLFNNWFSNTPPPPKKKLFPVSVTVHYMMLLKPQKRESSKLHQQDAIFFIFVIFFKYYTIYALSRYNRVCQQCCVHLARNTYLSQSSRPLVRSHTFRTPRQTTTRQPPYTGTTVITSPTALITGRHVDRCVWQ